MPVSDPAKMRAVRAWVVAVIVTSARAGGAPAVSDHWRPSSFDQVVRAVEPEVPAGWPVVAGGEVDGLDNGAEQMLGVQRLAGLGPAPGVLQPPPPERFEDGLEVGSGRCQAVPDLPPPRLAVGGDDPGFLKLAQALAERLGGDPAEAVHQVGEPLGAGEQVADHQQAPPVADAFQGARGQAEVVVGTNVPSHAPMILVDRYYLQDSIL